MRDLERDLRYVGQRIEYPAERDIAPLLRGRLEPPARAPWFRRRLVLALVTAFAVIGAAFAVPQARTAILHFFHIGGITIEPVERLPSVPPARTLDLGERVSLAKADDLADFRVVVPKRLGNPDAVYFDRKTPGGVVWLVYGSKRHVRLLLAEFIGENAPAYAEKQVAPGTSVERVYVYGERAVWISGKPHVVTFADRDGHLRYSARRLAGNTLIWQSAEMTFRLEGTTLTKSEALAIANAVSAARAP